MSKTKQNLDALKAEIPTVEIVCVDISDWKKTEEALNKIGTIDLLVNNAGFRHISKLGEITEENIDKLYSVNLKPLINISQIVIKRLKEKNKSGSIVNVSSVVSLVHFGSIIYSSGKAAMDRITKSMAVDLGPHMIRVNSVNPTIVITDQTKHIWANPQLTSKMKSLIPLGEFCDPEDVANAVLFLLSDKARMITGVILPIDGGQSAK